MQLNQFEKLWIGVFLLVNIFLVFIWGFNFIGLIASITGVCCVILAAKGNIHTYSIGLINTIAYAYLSYKQGYSYELFLNVLYFAPMQLVGLYIWSSVKMQKNTIVKTNYLKQLELVFYAACAIAVYFILQIFVPAIMNYLAIKTNPLPIIDNLTTTFSIIAVILMILRKVETWICWIIVNILSIYMWLVAGDYTVVVMWLAYLVNSFYGLYSWHKLQQISR